MAISSPHVDQDLIKYDLNVLSTHPPPCYDLLPPAHQFSFPVINFSFHLCCTSIVAHWTTAADLELNLTMKGKAALSLWKGSSPPSKNSHCMAPDGPQPEHHAPNNATRNILGANQRSAALHEVSTIQNLCVLINELFCWSMGAVLN